MKYFVHILKTYRNCMRIFLVNRFLKLFKNYVQMRANHTFLLYATNVAMCLHQEINN